MFPIIDTAAGMAFVYLLLSLVSSALRESVETVLRKRSGALKQGIERLLGEALAQKLYRHGLVAALADHPAGPCYIPPKSFSMALQDLVQAGETLPDGVRQVLRALEVQAAGDAARFETGLECWFDSTMDSVSGAYQRHTRAWLALIGIAVTVAMNADSILMASVLFGNSTVAVAVAEAGERFVPPQAGNVKEAMADTTRLSSFGLPIGWNGATRDSTLPWKEAWREPWKTPPAGLRCFRWLINGWLLLEWHWAGWLITVAAITVGAPFWFDLLNQVVRLRAAARSEEPS
jgi:hypothetical protein